MAPARKAAAETTPEPEARFRNRIVGLEYLDGREIDVHPQNWRVHPEEQRSALEAAFDSIGVADAVLAYRSERNEGRVTLIDGHLRHDMLDQQVPVLMLDLDDAEADILLASHDVLTTMAWRDEVVLAELLAGVADQIHPDLMIAIDPDLAGADVDFDELAAQSGGPPPKYPIAPIFDEGYDSVIIFSTSETDWAWLETILDLPTLRDGRRTVIGRSHVLTAKQFREWLDSQS